MDKKLSKSTIIILIIAVIAVGYYFAYERPGSVDEQSQKSEESQESSQEEQNSQTEIESVILINGIFQKTENDFLYFYPLDKEEIGDVLESVKLVQGVVFLGVTFSTDMEVLDEGPISLIDFQEGDGIMIFVSSEEEIVIEVRRIVKE